jgi:hypothetical protein
MIREEHFNHQLVKEIEQKAIIAHLYLTIVLQLKC